MQNELLKIWLDPVTIKPGLTRIDIKTENAPGDLFGVSFHMKSDGADYILKDYEIGNVFGGAEPVLMVTDRYDEKGHTVVFGVSLKRTDEAVVKDGVLSSLYIETLGNGELGLDFSNQIASVYKNGRKDLENVQWQGVNLNIRDAGAEIIDSKNGLEENVINTEIPVTKDYASDVFGVSKISAGGDDQIMSIYLFLIAVFITLIILFGSFFMILRKRWFVKQRPVKTVRDIIREYEEGRHL